MYSAVNKVGDKVKESVVHNVSLFFSVKKRFQITFLTFLRFQPILDKFNKEQDAFIKSQGGAGGSGACPWEGHQAADKIKEEIMALSAVSAT